jgi:hypothetical protein
MHRILLQILSLSILLSTSLRSHGGVSYELFFGVLRDASGNPLPNGTRVVLVADIDGNGLPGGLDGADITVNGLDPDAAFADFQGVELSVGQHTNNGDQIFYVGQIDGTLGGGTHFEPQFAYGTYPPDLADGQNFALYWFPGVSAVGAILPADPFEMGGFFNPNPNTNQSDIGMTLQVDDIGGVYKVYQIDSATAADYGESSSITDAAFSAIAVAPSEDDFAAWITGFFPGETDPAIVGFDADPDGDGLANGVESALGTAPDTPSTGLTAPVSTAPGTLVFTATLAKELLSDVSRSWEWSRDMVHWLPDGGSDGSTTVDFVESTLDDTPSDHDLIAVTASSPLGNPPPRLFVRLAATKATN